MATMVDHSKTRASILLGITDPLLAFQIDAIIALKWRANENKTAFERIKLLVQSIAGIFGGKK